VIKLERSKKPAYLTAEKVEELTNKFKATKASVWKHAEIGEALLDSSSFKCAYCECPLQIEDSYMQIEHFKDKDTYPDYVVDWENLLPSCQRCNRKKWTLDVVIEPIVNPYVDYPKNHFFLEEFRLYAKDLKGETTISKLDLNDDKRLVLPRFLASNEIASQLDSIFRNIINLDEARKSLSKLLNSCQADSPYAAFLSTCLHGKKEYQILKELLKSEEINLWDDEMEELDFRSKQLTLDRR
jgi:5-methylcytosine-specific restriction endonuclease McrA